MNKIEKFKIDYISYVYPICMMVIFAAAVKKLFKSTFFYMWYKIKYYPFEIWESIEKIIFRKLSWYISNFFFFVLTRRFHIWNVVALLLLYMNVTDAHRKRANNIQIICLFINFATIFLFFCHFQWNVRRKTIFVEVFIIFMLYYIFFLFHFHSLRLLIFFCVCRRTK